MKPSFHIGGQTRGIKTKLSGQDNQLQINLYETVIFQKFSS